MSRNLIEILTKCLVDTLIGLEFSDTQSEDAEMQLLEQIADHLSQLNEKDKILLIECLNESSLGYPPHLADFIKSIPESFGIITE